MEEVEIYTDGGCRGNPGLGAYAAIIYRNGEVYAKYGDCYEDTTNNEMEVSALLIALNFINVMVDSGSNFKYVIYTDSAYAVNTFNDWLEGWISTDRIKWKQNKDLWEQIYQLKMKLRKSGTNLSVVKVKGHSGVPKNVEVDKLVNKLMDEKFHTNLILRNPNLSYLQKVQLKGFSDTKDDSHIIHYEPLTDVNIENVYNVTNIYKEGDSVIAELKGNRVVIPIEQLKSILNELELE